MKEDKNNNSYLGGLLHAIGTLATGMKVTMKEFFTHKVTEQYPENRVTLQMYGRFRGTLEMLVDADGNNRCVACGLCQMSCPNGTIQLVTEQVEDPETGKKRKRLVEYRYDLGSCMFCQLCVNVCPHNAIRFNTRFEHAVYEKERLVKQLNKKED